MGTRLTQHQVITQFGAVHGDKYNYDNVIYKNDNTKVIIGCSIHGDFLQTPYNHKRGQQCPACKQEAQIARNKQTVSSIDHVIAGFRNVHGDFYDYTKVKYTNNLTKVDIICPVHGVFAQRPANHSSGQGCPACNVSKGERLVMRALELLSIPYIMQYKFDACINPKTNRKLRFDFFVPSANLAIEYDGIQHFKFIEELHKTEFQYEEMIYRDKLKVEYCNNNSIPLLHVVDGQDVFLTIKEQLESLK